MLNARNFKISKLTFGFSFKRKRLQGSTHINVSIKLTFFPKKKLFSLVKKASTNVKIVHKGILFYYTTQSFCNSKLLHSKKTTSSKIVDAHWLLESIVLQKFKMEMKTLRFIV